MLQALADRERWAGEAKRIHDDLAAAVDLDRAAHPKAHEVRGQMQDPEYEVEQALSDRPEFRRAKDNREAARRLAAMWASAATVEGLAVLLAAGGPGGQPPAT
jgi:hypothetical protein